MREKIIAAASKRRRGRRRIELGILNFHPKSSQTEGGFSLPFVILSETAPRPNRFPVILSEALRGPSRRIPRRLRMIRTVHSPASGDPSTTASLRCASARGVSCHSDRAGGASEWRNPLGGRNSVSPNSSIRNHKLCLSRPNPRSSRDTPHPRIERDGTRGRTPATLPPTDVRRHQLRRSPPKPSIHSPTTHHVNEDALNR